ncbi:MAG: PHP domain-containing protein [Bacteroidales bacterium]|nr:PHP domain-containing protein [Bacteroidales bacterium]
MHIHTILSPCGDIEMTPRQIVSKAKERGLHIIGITDHNSTRNSEEVKKVGNREGIFVLCGAEVTTKEEVHCLAFFETTTQLAAFQQFLDDNLPSIKNDEEKLGYQFIINEEEEILGKEEYLLINALNKSINEVEDEVHRLDGLFILAHIDKMQNSVLSQLGFMPPDLKTDALELSKHTDKEIFLKKNKYLSNHFFIQSSDAHYLEDIGCVYTTLEMQEPTFQNIKKEMKQHVYTY